MTASMVFEFQSFDLDTGTVQPNPPDLRPEAEQDLIFGYNSPVVPHATAFHNTLHNTGRKLAFLADTPFETVDFSNIATAVFSESLSGEPFGHGDTVILFTDKGSYFKVGNPIEVDPQPGDSGLVTFDYERLVPVPEPSTLLLAALAGLGLVAMRSRGLRSGARRPE